MDTLDVLKLVGRVYIVAFSFYFVSILSTLAVMNSFINVTELFYTPIIYLYLFLIHVFLEIK